ncbi:MAG TPA: tetratricopeptide repeat protein, partial [Actinomycetota bacterium]
RRRSGHAPVPGREEPAPENRRSLLDVGDDPRIRPGAPREAPDEIRRRHASHYLALAEVSDQTVAVEAEAHLLRLDEEWGNLRAGLEWSCRGGDPSIALRLSGALWRFWWDRGAAREGTAWYEAALAAGADEPEELRARALYGAANMAMARNDPAEAILLLERCLPVFRLGGDDLRAMRTVNDLGISSEMAGNFERARRYFEESLALALASSDERSAASARVNLAYVALQEDRLEDARGLLRDVVSAMRALGDRAVVGTALQNLALADVRSADLDSAASNVRESIRLARDVADMRGGRPCACRVGRRARGPGGTGSARPGFLRDATRRAGTRASSSNPWSARFSSGPGTKSAKPWAKPRWIRRGPRPRLRRWRPSSSRS